MNGITVTDIPTGWLWPILPAELLAEFALTQKLKAELIMMGNEQKFFTDILAGFCFNNSETAPAWQHAYAEICLGSVDVLWTLLLNRNASEDVGEKILLFPQILQKLILIPWQHQNFCFSNSMTFRPGTMGTFVNISAVVYMYLH